MTFQNIEELLTVTETGAEQGTRYVGTVKFFKEDVGFGFCSRKDDGDVFIHAKDLRRGGIQGGVLPGDVLEFETVVVPGKAPKAVNIKRVSSGF